MYRKCVVVKGGGRKPEPLSGDGDKHFVEQVNVEFLTTFYSDIDRTTSLRDALRRIVSHSGKQIAKTSDVWVLRLSVMCQLTQRQEGSCLSHS